MTADPAETTEPPTDAAAASRWPRALVDALAADPRVVGAADLSDADCTTGNCRLDRKLVVVTTWDGGATLPAELPRLGALAAGAGVAEAAVAASVVEPGNAAAGEVATWRGLTADLVRVEVVLVRIGDLKPSARGEKAVVVLDPRGLVDQWIRWSHGRDRAREAQPPRTRDADLLDVADLVASAERFVVGTVHLTRGGPQPLRPLVVPRLREVRAGLDVSSPVEAALAARIDAVLATCPHPGEGYRVVPDRVLAPEGALERFLRVADGEGFLGDRVLFDAAARRLAELSRRTPVFDEGFVVPTFDLVEARWRFGEGIGGCKVPLVPAVHVGVGVTPEDHLEFWAAPAVRVPPATVACVADSGARVVRERTVGKDALLAALLGEVERAWDELPDLLRAARRAGRQRDVDVDAALRPLHLPRSYREAAKAALPRGGEADCGAECGSGGGASRLGVAFALTRVGTGEAPLNARKLGLAAGRLLATTPPGDEDGCPA